MRVFATSDLHVDYEANLRWVEDLSAHEYADDILIVAGDISHKLDLVRACLQSLVRKFKRVMFVPGNHDLWTIQASPPVDSLSKFQQLCHIARDSGASVETERFADVTIVPLFSWYDYSFGTPSADLLQKWTDYHACKWPAGMSVKAVTDHFLGMNSKVPIAPENTIISFSHFLPRIDLMPNYIPPAHRFIYPVLGAERLDSQVRALRSKIHVYGHSHINRKTELDGLTYVNCALAYPHEARLASRTLHCIHESA
ncbi:metallophosphoesterase [Bradyrhizobium nitroreducens]|uniref:Metallophosphoesterase n=1 Tax=Bradyrhizobium nitroreducens TaxID=709803 RepID=A0A2M6U857_9BRAD|nr:metallophosphoesterase [Bradyrhizobium nitroreducens]PIT00786.1 metallophosphoesterase [Bradyrhizobium nitroreducens]